MYIVQDWEMFYTTSKEDIDLVDQISIDIKNKRFILTVREARYLKSTGLHPLWSPRGESVTCLLASSVFWWRPAFLGLWAHHPLPLCTAVSFLCLSNLPLQLSYFFGGGGLLFFNWRNIALQCCAGFWHTTVWISHNYTYTSLPNHSPPIHPSRTSLNTVLSVIQQLPTGYLFDTWECIYQYAILCQKHI